MSSIKVEEVLEGLATFDSGDEYPFSSDDSADNAESGSDSDNDKDEEDVVRRLGARARGIRTRAAEAASSTDLCLQNGTSDGDCLPQYPRVCSQQGGFSDQVSLSDDPKPLEFFGLMVPDSVFKICTEQTNKYAVDYFAANPKSDHKAHSRVHPWPDDGITEAEMKTFLALTIAMGLLHQQDMQDYWSRDEVMETPFFPSMMTRDRFLLIFKFFHLSDNDAYHPRNHPQHDPMHKLGAIYQTLAERFQTAWHPGKDICVDEGVAPFRGHDEFLTSNPDRTDRYKLKAYHLCDLNNGYCCEFEMYGGKGKELSGKGMAGDAVSRLVEPYLQKGHKLKCDDSHTSSRLFLGSHNAGTNARETRRQPKRRHTGKEVSKLDFISEYSQYLSTVDASNMSFRWRALKWWKKAFFHMLSLALVNAHVLHKEHMSSRGKKALEHKEFRREVVKELIATSGYERVGQERRTGAGSLLRLTGRHFLEKNPAREDGRVKVRTCQVCCPAERKYRRERGFLLGKRAGHESAYQCQQCQVVLCITPCMKLYHTEEDYQEAWIRLMHPNE
ncbi:piggyBac transposable element-derived protein 4-like [Branchiostoma floridae]|uniref:PiggyBac transposable element-derived protein 4-like n=1 Tax=Branchiostoma floridae TaxID=7739 RepID=A0A9J7M7F9_BRAFL|nr:piggyBac transposable element-derived protein 4-like [Branchiostoma floridae]